MEVKMILVGYDGSAQAEKAVDTAVHFASAFEAEVLVFAVARPPEPSISVELHAVLDEAKEHYEDGFKALLTRTASSGVRVSTEIAVGHPAEQLIHKAESVGAGLIVVGRKGHSRLEQLILGSTSERVIRFAHCPVLVVK